MAKTPHGWRSLEQLTSSGSGIRSKSARSVGGVTDIPPNARLQKLIDEVGLPEAPPPLPQDRASKQFANKYKIRDGQAHITPTLFRDLLASTDKLSGLKQRGVKTIAIDEGVVSMVLTLYNPDIHRQTEWVIQSQSFPDVPTTDILKYGLVQAVGTDTKKVILGNNRIIGYLEVLSTDPVLSRMGAQMGQGKIFSSAFGRAASYQTVLEEPQNFKEAAAIYSHRGGLLLSYSVGDGELQKAIPLALVVDDTGLSGLRINRDELPAAQLYSLYDRVITAIKKGKDDPQRILGMIFEKARSGYAVYGVANRSDSNRVGYLLPPPSIAAP